MKWKGLTCEEDEEMGVYLGLEIIPDYINQDEWERVFEESFKLIQAYPFATLSVEQKDDYKRLVLEPTKEQHQYMNGKMERYWKINGDLESKEIGESFTLSSNLERYKERKEDIPEKDILLYQAKDSGRRASKVFHAKTQGLPYHTPLLAVAALIESRFPQYACVYGDITKEQAQKAVEWANSILDKPIKLPVRVDPQKLLERLKAIDSKEKQLGALYELFIGDSEDEDRLVAKHFSIETVSRYLANELRHFNSATQLGAELLIIKGLNIGLPLEALIDICCFHENGPRFIPVEFSKALCSTWIMVAPEIKRKMNCLNKSPEAPETVESQFGSIILDMNFMGRRTKRFIPQDEVLKVLKEKFNESNEIVEIIETKHQEIVTMIEEQGRRLEEIEVELHSEYEQNIVSTFENLLHWDETKVVSEGICEVLITIKNATNNSLSKKDSQVMQMIGGLEKGPLIKLITKLAQEQHNLILSRSAWDWIEAENNDSLKRMVIVLLALENKGSATKLYRAVFENKGLFYKYMK